MLTTRYGRQLADEDVQKYFNKIKNDIFKLLPLREEQAEWKKHLTTVLVELNGFKSLTEEFKFISVLAKLESLFELEDFMLYRKTVFEILGLIDGLR
jgi:hypothetical protein